MNELAVAACLDREPYRHMVVPAPHPSLNEYRFACPCEWVSEWFPKDGPIRMPDHPDGLVTVSRTDLTVIPHPSQMP